MKTQKLIKIFVSLLTVICMVLGLIGCQIKVNVIGLSDYYYDNSEKYIAGEAKLTQTVESIDINWMVGNVTVSAIDGDGISFSEESQTELVENTMLHYWLEDTSLHIKFCGLGKWDFSKLGKDLTVLVPKKLVINNLEVKTLSANVNLLGCAVLQSVEIDTVSGKTETNLTEPLNKFYGRSTSGEFKVNVPSVSHFDVGSVSGDVSLSTQKEPDKLDVDTTSGNINLNLPENASFTLYYSATSGDLYSDLKFSRSSIKYIFGDGKGEYMISSVSGDVRIVAKKN